MNRALEWAMSSDPHDLSSLSQNVFYCKNFRAGRKRKEISSNCRNDWMSAMMIVIYLEKYSTILKLHFFHRPRWKVNEWWYLKDMSCEEKYRFSLGFVLIVSWLRLYYKIKVCSFHKKTWWNVGFVLWLYTHMKCWLIINKRKSL